MFESENSEIAPPLSRRHAENLSLYSATEEEAGLEAIAAKLNLECHIIPLGDAENPIGYLMVSKDPKKIATIVAEAPLNFIDYDDTLAQYSNGKKKCWSQLEKMGFPSSVIKACDRLSRLTFDPNEGEIYSPQLDMRFLTHAQNVNGNETDMLKAVENYAAEVMASPESATGLFTRVAPDEHIEAIFRETRFNVELYPGTMSLLHDLHQNGSDLVRSNVIPLTYGDVLFQAEKSLSLLKSEDISAIVLTKAKKGKALRHFFEQNPLKSLPITYRYPESQGLGIDVARFHQPVAVTDDDPGQVETVQQLSRELGFPIEARRVISPDQKRAGLPTPQEGSVVELKRDAELNLETDVVAVQAAMFESALINYTGFAFSHWLEDVISLNGFEAVQAANPRAIAHDFLREFSTARDLLASAGIYHQEKVKDAGRYESLLAVKEAYLTLTHQLITQKMSSLTQP